MTIFESFCVVYFILMFAALAVVAIQERKILRILNRKKRTDVKTQELADFIQDLDSGVGFIRVEPHSVVIRSPRGNA